MKALTLALLVLVPALAAANEQPEECRLYAALLTASAPQLAAKSLLPAQAEALKVLHKACNEKLAAQQKTHTPR